MPQVVPVSDFRSNVQSVSRYTDNGEVVVLTQHGRPKWAMIDYDEWNAAAAMQERTFAAELKKTEAAESDGSLRHLSTEEFEKRQEERKELLRASSLYEA